MPKVPFTIDNKFLADVREAVLQYAYKRFGLSGLDIEDLVQEALMTMFDNVQSGKLTGLTCNLKTYVIGILKNIASMKLREMKPFVGDINQSDDEDTVDPVDLEVAKAALRRWQENDGQTELKENTVHQLIGRGDMLYLQGNDPIRVQCAFVDTPEVVDINKFIASQQGYSAPYELPEPKMEESDMGGEAADVDLTHLDPLFEDAARLIVSNQSGSTSLIQRKFAIGYNRAGRLMDQLEKAGVVGAAMGSKPREVMVLDEVSLNNLLSNLK